MMTMRVLSGVSTLLLLAAPLVGAQQVPAARPLGPVTKVSADGLLGSVSAVRPLPNGKVIVNDILRRQVLLLDAELKKEVVIADTTAATANAYGARAAGMIPYFGDSTLFIDPGSLSMLVIDPNGEVNRVMAIPRPDDAGFMVGGPFGSPGMDTKGRIVYRGFLRPDMRGMAPPQPGQPFRMPTQADTAPIFRVSLTSRQLDTAAYFKIPTPRVNVAQNDAGQMQVSVMLNPMPVVDDWALMPDGTIAVLRGKDYHLDFLRPDGKWESTPKIPFGWERMDDDEKSRVVDSARVAAEAQRSAQQAAMQGGNAAALAGAAAQAGFAGAPMMLEMRVGGGGGGPGGPPSRTQAQQGFQMPSINMIPPNELPDYRPAFRQGSLRADTEGNLWIRTTLVANGGPVYDVVNGQGELVDRVSLPFGRVIAGFAPGLVFMGVNDGTGARLEIARIK